MKQRLKR
ncbi:class II aldolase, tagatose bisphosphate family, partial [Yersinia pestis PY-95]